MFESFAWFPNQESALARRSLRAGPPSLLQTMNAILQAVREQELGLELVEAALAASPECFAVVEDGRIVYANPALAGLFGYGAERLPTGKRLSEFVPGTRACTRSSSAEVPWPKRACGYPSCAFEFQGPDGVRLQIEARCAPFTFQGRDLLVVHMRDISHGERRRLVRDSDERFRAIVDEAAIGILQCTIDGHVLDGNRAALRMLGYNDHELRNRSISELTYAEDVKACQSLFDELISKHKQSHQKELRYVRKDQAWGWARLTTSLVRGPDGKPEFALLMMEDLTEYKRAELQLREAQKMEAIGRLVGGVAHDFNNLLTGIMLYSDLLKAGLQHDSRLSTYIDEIRLASEHGGALIQQLLSVAKRQNSEPHLLSLNQIVSDMQNLMSRLIGEHIELRTDLDPALWQTRMDPTQAQQVLLNLVINARDAMPDGGRVEVSTRNLPSSLQPGAAQVELVVKDNGSGMSPDILAHVFEPFFTTKAADHGNGLGLTTVHRIVRENGGTIEITSEPEKGTCVRIRFLSSDTAQPGLAPATPEISACGGETILLVEDNESIRSSAKHILQQRGYGVLEVSSGREALRVFQEQSHNIHLLLSDLMLPGSDGREVAARIHEINPSLPVIFTSGYELDRSPATINEPVVIFRKPFAGKALVQKVREVLDHAAKLSQPRDQKKRKPV